jgi:carbonic anhydrase
MSNIHDQIVKKNKVYAASFGEKSKLGLPPSRKFAILTCMDARLDPAKYAGLAEGDAHVIRNAGGRATDDAIRSLIISHKLLGTNEWFIIHHTNCGMELFTNDIMGDLLSTSLKTATHDGEKWSNIINNGGSLEGKFINWHTIRGLKDSVFEDVSRIKNHPLVNKDISVYGFIYDVTSGKLIEL